MLKTGKGALGLDLLGFFYTDAEFTDEHIRKIANMGFKWVRIFNASKDQMELRDYNIKHYDNVKKVSEKLLKVDRKLVLDFSGYTHRNMETMNHDDFVKMFVRSYRQIKYFIPIDSLYIQIANELNRAPKGFEGSSKKESMPEQMRKLFRWYKCMSDVLEAEGFPREQIVGNCEDNKNYPKVPSNAEAVIAGIRGMPKLGAGGTGKLEAKQMVSAWHKVLFKEDIPGRIYKAQRLEKYFCSDDGKSKTGKKGHGYWVVNAKGKKVYQSTDTSELYYITKAMMELARDGIKHKLSTHKVHIGYFMLPREKTIYDKKKSKFMFNLNLLDWDRMAIMPEAFRDVFGKYPEGYGQYEPEIIPEPEPPKPKPIPEPIIPEEVKTMREQLNEVWFKLTRLNFKAFWDGSLWEQKLSAVSILVTFMSLVWLLIKAF